MRTARLGVAAAGLEAAAPPIGLPDPTMSCSMIIRWWVAVPAVLSLAPLAGCLVYFLLPPVSEPVTLLTTTEAGSPSTVGQARATDTPTVVDQLRPSDEDIAKAFRRSTEDWRPGEVQDAPRDSDEPAITGPIPLPKKRPPAASAEVRKQAVDEFGRWRKARARLQ